MEKTRKAGDIGRASGLFRVPSVLDYHPDSGRMVLERIDAYQPAWEVLFKESQSGRLIERIGRALAVIHVELWLPQAMTVDLPQEFSMPGTEVFLHGDFNGANVGIEPRTGNIVVLDWQMTSRHGGEATYGSRYFDLIWFVNYLIWRPTLGHLFGDPVAPLAERFVKSYLREVGLCGLEQFAHYCHRFFAIKAPFRRTQARWWDALLLPRCTVLSSRFVARLGHQ